MGFLADRVRFGITIPICFFLTGGFFFLLQLSDSAAGALTFVGEIGANVVFMVSLMLLSTLMTKSVPQESKGTLLGLFWSCGTLGNLFCSKAGGELFDLDKNLPFIGVAILYWVYALIVGILSCSGTFSQ